MIGQPTSQIKGRVWIPYWNQIWLASPSCVTHWIRCRILICPLVGCPMWLCTKGWIDTKGLNMTFMMTISDIKEKYCNAWMSITRKYLQRKEFQRNFLQLIREFWKPKKHFCAELCWQFTCTWFNNNLFCSCSTYMSYIHHFSWQNTQSASRFF